MKLNPTTFLTSPQSGENIDVIKTEPEKTFQSKAYKELITATQYLTNGALAGVP